MADISSITLPGGGTYDLKDKNAVHTNASGILKGDGHGGVSAATPGTDYGTYSKPSGGIPASDLANGVIPTVPSAYTSNPAMDGTASPGSSGAWAKGDHVHPSDTSRVPVYGLGKNLLDNWYFGNPLNQRGATIYTASGYTIDRWKNYQWQVASPSISITSDGIRLQSSTASGTPNTFSFAQTIPSWLAGRTVTVSLLYSNNTNGNTRFFLWNNGTAVNNPKIPTGSGLWKHTVTIPSSLTSASFQIGLQGSYAGSGPLDITLIAMKVELGTEQTLAHLEDSTWVLNEIPDYEEELIKCQTSTADSSDTYANKTLATEQEIAYVENGTTASRNYEKEEWIAWRGKLYKTDNGIYAGSTFYASGGNKNLTEAGAGGFNTVNKREALITGNIILEVSGRTAVLRSNGNTATSANIRSIEIPQYYRPKANVSVPFVYYNGSTWVNDGRFLMIYSGAGNIIISNLLGGIDRTIAFDYSVFSATWTF